MDIDRMDELALKIALWILVGSLAISIFVPVGWVFLKTLGAI